MRLIGCCLYWGGFNHMVKLCCSTLRTSLFSFAKDVGLGRRAVEGLMMCPSKIATLDLAKVLITYTDSIGNWGSRNPLWRHQEKCMEGRSASLSTCTIWQRVRCSLRWLDSYLGVILVVSQKWTVHSSTTVTISSMTKYRVPAWTSRFQAASTYVASWFTMLFLVIPLKR